MTFKSHYFRRFNWSLKLVRSFLKKRVNNEYDANVIITGRRGKGKSTLAYKILFGYDDFDPEKEICYTKEKMNDNLMERGGYAHADEGVVNFSRGNTTTKANKELYEILTKNRDNFKITTWCIPSIENVDRNILQYCCMWIHVDRRGVACVFLPKKSSVFEKDKWNIDTIKKKYEKFLEKAKPNQSFPYWKFEIFRGWIKFGKLPQYQQEIVDKIKQRDKNLNTKKEEPKEDIKEIEVNIQTEINTSRYSVPELANELAKKMLNKEIVSRRQLNDIIAQSKLGRINVLNKINQLLKMKTQNLEVTTSSFFNN